MDNLICFATFFSHINVAVKSYFHICIRASVYLLDNLVKKYDILERMFSCIIIYAH